MEYLFNALSEDFIDITCLVPILRTFGNIIAKDWSDNSANVFIYTIQNKKGSIIRNILINNRDINLNDECAWLLGNAFKAIHFTELSGNNHSKKAELFDKICDYFLL